MLLKFGYNWLMEPDAYFHKTVSFNAWTHRLQFRTSQELFSSHDIDTGSKLLLRTIVEGGYDGMKRILDLGCGYGALGLTLKSLYPDSLVHLTDRDALAVDYARQNAVLNGLDDTQIYGSLGYDDVQRDDFNLIVTNIPGKAGENVIAGLLQEARYYLAPGGLVAIVVVSPLESLVEKVLADTPGAAIILKRNRPGHTVFHYRFSGDHAPLKPALSALERGIYHRQKATTRLDELEYTLQTAYGLKEFDSLSYGSQMLIKALADLRGRDFTRVVVLNPGQGHVPAALWQLLHPQKIALVDRDLLALRYSHSNLVTNGCPPECISVFHQVGVDLKTGEQADLWLGVLREEEGKAANILTIDQIAAQLSPDGLIILSAGSTAITRLAADVAAQGQLRIKSRERWRGYSLLALVLV